MSFYDQSIMDKKRYTYIKLILPITAAALVAAVVVFAWHRGAFLPKWITWKEKQVEDASCTITLDHRRVQVYDGERVLWESPKDIQVSDFLWCDIDHDDAPELLLLCWRVGRYGNAKPFWEKGDEHTWSQHIFIYDWLNPGIKPSWMASDIGMDAADWSFDPENRLVITETSGRRTGWDWLSWGLELIRTY